MLKFHAECKILSSTWTLYSGTLLYVPSTDDDPCNKPRFVSITEIKAVFLCKGVATHVDGTWVDKEIPVRSHRTQHDTAPRSLVIFKMIENSHVFRIPNERLYNKSPGISLTTSWSGDGI